MTIDPNILLKGQTLDVAAGIKEGADASLASTKADSARIDLAQQRGDEAAMREYVTLPDTDMYTSKGMENALKDLKGRISMSTYSGLLKKHADLKANELTAGEKIHKLSAEQLADTEATNERILAGLAPLVSDDTDPEDWNSVRDAGIARLAAQKKADGSSLMDPKMLEQFKIMPKPVFDQMYAHSKVAGEQIKRAKENAEIARIEAQTTALEDGNLNEQWSDDGVNFLKSSKTGKVVALDDAGAMTPVAALPAGAIKLAGKAPTQLQAKVARSEAVLKDPWTFPGVMEAAKIEALTGQQTSIGYSSGLKEPVTLLAKRIRNDPILFEAPQRYAANRASLTNITKQNDVTASSANAVKQLMEDIKPYLGKQDPSGMGIKKLNELIVDFQAHTIGDPALLVSDQFATDIKTDIARVIANVTGAAGTPVAFLKTGEVYFPKGLTEEGYKEIYKGLTKSMDSRTKSNAAQMEAISQRGQKDFKAADERINLLYPKSSSPEGRAPDTKVAPADQKAKDTDAVGVMRAELVKSRDKIRTLTSTPLGAGETADGRKAEITRLEDDIASISREIKAKGGGGLAEPASTNPKVTVSGW